MTLRPQSSYYTTNGVKYQTGTSGFSLPANIGDMDASVTSLNLSGYNLTGKVPLPLSFSLPHFILYFFCISTSLWVEYSYMKPLLFRFPFSKDFTQKCGIFPFRKCQSQRSLPFFAAVCLSLSPSPAAQWLSRIHWSAQARFLQQLESSWTCKRWDFAAINWQVWSSSLGDK